jgi:hypothetical protein
MCNSLYVSDKQEKKRVRISWSHAAHFKKKKNLLKNPLKNLRDSAEKPKDLRIEKLLDKKTSIVNKTIAMFFRDMSNFRLYNVGRAE